MIYIIVRVCKIVLTYKLLNGCIIYYLATIQYLSGVFGNYNKIINFLDYNRQNLNILKYNFIY